jgi:hypothetical protein
MRKRFPTGRFIVAEERGLETKNKKEVDRLYPHPSEGKVFYQEKGVIMTTSYYGHLGFLPSGRLEESSSVYKRIKNYLKL